MKTKEVKEFYEQKVGDSATPYEYDRWQKNPQARASYVATKWAVRKYALPLLKDGVDILELGPGPGTWTKLLLEKAPQAHFTLVDISSEMLKQATIALAAHSNIEYVNVDILDFSTDKQYDFFFSSRIIEYVPEKEKAIKIIANCLKPGAVGYIVTKTPQARRAFSRPNKSPVHQSQISAAGLRRVLEEHGLRVERVVNVTSVFPKLKSGWLDQRLSCLCRHLPFSVCRYLSESYAIVFRKNDH
jgi:ubiquinone/menaquinone biosynthesis C-methylase UbiE